ncbi:ABC transporter permease [Corynebacterium liangguodongii]|uniref:ABC transporter permease n=1 Tax=Corynebacterium liangguodongii TaxID=2079535 RepID=A0A2S0WCW4_9CORY|nr:ABC transporter permease [Corynebacterium liangguodongii]AWB83605.1 ABC transporter permease [Corynebacterium liangguodongii]PWB99588.1 ABC transporter permease [Corynebacterium liangguodongii]
MVNHLLHRFPPALLTLVLGSIVIFALLRVFPGDPAEVMAGADAPPEAIDSIRRSLGLDRPVLSQYFAWIGSIMTLNFGDSYVIGGSISELLSAAALNTCVLASSALILSMLIALILGVGVELIDVRWARDAAAAITTLALAIPNFVVGTVLLIVFSVVLAVLPAGGIPREGLSENPEITVQFLVLPAIVLALPVGSQLARFLQDSISRELRASYVTTARALGIPRSRIILTQVLPNALPAALTVLGLEIGHIFGGTVIVEALFAWPGLGYLTQQAIINRDYPVVQIILLLSVALYVFIQLASDITHAVLDPRIRIGAR